MQAPPLFLGDPARAGIRVPPWEAPRAVQMLRPGGVGDVPPPASPNEGMGTNWDCNAAQRVQLAGGALNSLMVHPMVTPFEQLYRRLPEEGMFQASVNPDRPFVFELGAFQCPQTFGLLLFDLRPDIYRFSGIDPGDTVPVESRRFSSILGFELRIDGQHPGNTMFQLDPVPIQTTQEAFTAPIIPGNPGPVLTELGLVLPFNPASRFNIAAASSFAAASGAGTSLMPQRPQGYGPTSVPFTLLVRANQVVQLRCVIFRPIPSPVAFFEYDIGGLLLPEEWIDSMNECMKPMTNASGGYASRGGGPR